MTEKLFTIRCMADAVVCERWTVLASSPEEAQERFDADHESIRFIEDFGIENENDRRAFEMAEAQPEDSLSDAAVPLIAPLRLAEQALAIGDENCGGGDNAYSEALAAVRAALKELGQ